LVRFSPKSSVDPRYIFWASRSSDFLDQINADAIQTTIANFNGEKYGNITLWMPPHGDQSAIASFLDRKTQAIDALIAELEALLLLLQDKRQALITQAVTKGLDPSVPMKDSGIPWLGEIPAHWEVKRLMHLTQPDRPIMYGIVLPGPDVEEGVPIVKGGDVAPGRLLLERLKRTTREIESRYERSRLQGGDIVFAIRGSIGAAEMVPPELKGANLTQDAARIAPTSSVEGSWLLHLVRSHPVFAQLESGASGAAVKGINICDLKRPFVPVPPLGEQRDIGDFLDSGEARAKEQQAEISMQINELVEYRQALITAAVTGKIDVTQETPQ